MSSTDIARRGKTKDGHVAKVEAVVDSVPQDEYRRHGRMATYGSLAVIIGVLFVASTIWSIILHFAIVFAAGMMCGTIGVDRVLGMGLSTIAVVTRGKYRVGGVASPDNSPSRPVGSVNEVASKQIPGTGGSLVIATVPSSHTTMHTVGLYTDDYKSSSTHRSRGNGSGGRSSASQIYHHDERSGGDSDDDDDEIDTRDLRRFDRRDSGGRRKYWQKQHHHNEYDDNSSHLARAISEQVPNVISGVGSLIIDMLTNKSSGRHR